VLQDLRNRDLLFVIDGGDLLARPRLRTEADRRQAEVKSDLFAGALQEGGIDAMAIGKGDVAIGWEAFRQFAAKHTLPYVAANIECTDGAPFPAQVIVEKGDVTIGVIAVAPKDLDAGDCTVTDPITALKQVAGTLPDTVDVVLAVAMLREDDAKALAEATPTIDFILTSKGLSFSNGRPLSPDQWLLGAGSRGKRLGVLTGTTTPGHHGWENEKQGNDLQDRVKRYNGRLKTAQGRLAEATEDRIQQRAQRQVDFYTKEIAILRDELAALDVERTVQPNLFKTRLHELSAGVPDSDPIEALLAKTLELLGTVERAANARSDDPLPTFPRFAGHPACASCHPDETAHWARSGHASAYATLVDEERELDADCYRCHVTGAFHPDGPQTPAHGALLASVQCEACHGPAADHAKEPRQHKPAKTPPLATCTQCHDAEQDMGRFDPDTYWPKVVHTTP
jgi:hypothetical protein